MVAASKTTLTELFGVGPIIAATVIGDVGDVARFPTRDRFAAYNGTAPIEVSSGGRRKVFRLRPAPWQPSAQPRHSHGCRHSDPVPAHRRSCLLRPQDRRRPLRQGSDPRARSGGLATPSTFDCVSTLNELAERQRAATCLRVREGNRGTTLSPAWPAHTPSTGSSAKPLPNPTPPNGPAPPRRSRRLEALEKPLDTKRTRAAAVPA